MKEFPVKITGSYETPEEYNDFTTELANAVEDTNQTMQQAKHNQLSGSMSNYSTMGDFYTCTGTSTAYVLTAVSAQQGMTELFDGARVRFVANVSSGNNPTINVNALGAKSIKKNNGQDNVVTGDIPIGDHIDLVYVLSGTYWLLTINRSQHSTVLNNYIDGLTIEQDTDTDHDIKVNLGICADNTNTTYMKVVTPFVKQIDANWAEGTGNGGFPSGLTLAINTWYHFFLIKKNDGTIDGGFDSSIAAINLLSDAGSSYEWYRRIGSIKTGDPANIIDFIQIGDTFLWNTPVLDASGQQNTTNAVTKTLTVAINVKVKAIMNVHISSTGALDALLYLSSLETQDLPPGDTSNPLSTQAGEGGPGKGGRLKTFILTNNSAQIRSRVNNVNNTVEIAILGWIDPRGKDNL